jgi:hypothetical protein
MSGSELAYIEDVGILRPGFGRIPRFVKSGVDVRITESGLSLTPSGKAVVLGGEDTTYISFTDVKRIRVKKDSVNPEWHILTVSYFKGGRHWWNRGGTGQLVLRDFQLAQVLDALNRLPALKNKLNL